jgi:hypothetical protein
MDPESFTRLLSPTLSASKSSTASTRTASLTLFRALASAHASDPAASHNTATSELLAPLKAGKTVSAEHRTTLFGMLGALPASPSTSPSIVQAGPALLAKETNEPAAAALASSLTPHLVFALREGAGVEPAGLAALTKEMAGQKPALRRAAWTLVGGALWALGGVDPSGVKEGKGAEFVAKVVPALEAGLKVVAGNPLAAPAGAMEGYVALALMLDPLAKVGTYGASTYSLYVLNPY